MFGRKKRETVEAVGNVEVWGDKQGVVLVLNGTPNVMLTLSLDDATRLQQLIGRAVDRNLP